MEEALAAEIIQAFGTICSVESKKYYEALEFQLNSDFKTKYLSEVLSIRYLPSSDVTLKQKLMEEVTVLWKGFAEYFLTEYIQYGLLIPVEAKEIVKPVVTNQVTKQNVWETLSDSEVENQKDKLSSQSQIHMDILKAKIANIAPLADEVTYRILTLRVDYPFWERNWKQTTDFHEKLKRATHDIGNLVELEAVKSNEIQSLSGEIPSFSLTILVKLDARRISPGILSRPTLAMLLEKTSKENCNEKILATEALSKLIRSAFPAYQNMQLTRWMFGVTKVKKDFQDYRFQDDES